MISYYVGKFLIETLAVQSNDTTELTGFDLILQAIQGKQPFTKQLQNFSCTEIESILQSMHGVLKYSSFSCYIYNQYLDVVVKPCALFFTR